MKYNFIQKTAAIFLLSISIIGARMVLIMPVSADTAGLTLEVTDPIDFGSPTINPDGFDVTISPALVHIQDATNSDAGWHVTATSTTFTTTTTPIHTLPDNSISVLLSSSPNCYNGLPCTLPSTNQSYPYLLPSGATAPTATTIFAADVGSGSGDVQEFPTFTMHIPGNAYAGSYTSTLTFSIISGP